MIEIVEERKPGHLLHYVAWPHLKVFSPLWDAAGDMDKLYYGRVCNIHRVLPLACCSKER